VDSKSIGCRGRLVELPKPTGKEANDHRKEVEIPDLPAVDWPDPAFGVVEHSSHADRYLVARTCLAADAGRSNDQALRANRLLAPTASHASNLPFVLETVVSSRISFDSDGFRARDKARSAVCAELCYAGRFNSATIALWHGWYRLYGTGYVP